MVEEERIAKSGVQLNRVASDLNQLDWARVCIFKP